MRTIGIRASPKSITFVIYDDGEDSVVNIEKVMIPAAFTIPEALKYVRSTLLDILREYGVERAGIRVSESNAQSFSIERVQIEGVIQETFASSDLKSYYVGQISSISRRLDFDRARFKPMIAGDNDLNVENWDGLSKEAREATLCALGAKNA